MSRYCLGTILIDKNKIEKIKYNCNKFVSDEFPNIEGLYHVDYGYDHACGFFIDFFDLEDQDRTRQIDSLFHLLTDREFYYIISSLEDTPIPLDDRGIFSCN